jgi:hypothetical protein
VYSNNINAGVNTASASYSFTGDTNHTGSSDSKNFSIGRAPVTATAGSGSTTYDGATHAPSACAVAGLYKGGLVCANAPASVGPGVSTTTIVPNVSGDVLANFDITLANGTYAIGQASSTTVVSCPASVTYNAAPQTPCSATVTGAGGLSLTPTPAYTNNINAGVNAASASYTYAGDANHTGSTDTKDVHDQQSNTDGNGELGGRDVQRVDVARLRSRDRYRRGWSLARANARVLRRRNSCRGNPACNATARRRYLHRARVVRRK